MAAHCGLVRYLVAHNCGSGHTERVILLVPADALRPRRPDEHFAAEATAARALGLTAAVIDHDELTQPGGAGRAVAKVPTDSGPAVYRGWMLRSEQYAELDQALRARQVTLRTSAEQYRRAHELPGWYAALTAVTPATEWTTGDSRAEFDQARGRLGAGAAVLKDYTKSMKHY